MSVAIVTGASGHLGAAVAERLLNTGVTVAGIGNSRLPPGMLHSAIQADISNQAEVDTCVSSVAEDLGDIDILINVAGVNAPAWEEWGKFEDFDCDRIGRSSSVNMTGTIRMTQAVIRHWIARKRGGVIVLVSSIYGLAAPDPTLRRGQHKPVDYVVTKAWMPVFSKYIAALYPGIRCNCVAPHGIGHPDHSEQFEVAFALRSPAGRLARMAEVVNAIVWLAGEESAYVNGITLPVDGGWTAAR